MSHPAAPDRVLLARSVRGTGPALVVSSTVLLMGALCHLPSYFRSIRDVGILLSAIIVSALVADLFVLPLLIERLVRGRRRNTIEPSERT